MIEAGPKVAIYARVSTADQDVTTQIARLRSAPIVQGASSVEEFSDDGVSGSLASRPAFDRLRKRVASAEVNVVVAAKLDRLGRSARAVLEFFELCEQHEVRVVLADQALDTGTPAGRLLRTVMAAVAEFERDLAVERTREKLAAIRSGIVPTRSGRPIGRPRIRTPEIVAEARRLRAEGLRWAEVARKLHHPAASLRKWSAAPNTPAGETPTGASERSSAS